MVCAASSTNAAASPAGLQLLAEASISIILSSPMSNSLPKQSTASAPHAPKKDRFVKSCAAAVPYIRSLRFDVGGGDKPFWLSLNHRVNPMQKVKMSPDDLHKRKVEELHFRWSHISHNLHKSKKQKSEAHEHFVSADVNDTSTSKND